MTGQVSDVRHSKHLLSTQLLTSQADKTCFVLPHPPLPPPPPRTQHIYLTDGASAGVRNVLQSIIRDERDAVLVPIPQYPLYSASISLYGGKLLPYQLEESHGWGLDLDALSQQVGAARQEGYSIRWV